MKGDETTGLFPAEIVLEVTNSCNLRCRHCHYHGQGAGRKRPTAFMEPGLWEKLLDEIEKKGAPVTVMTHGAGEPLLYPGLRELLLRAKSIPHVTVGFMTNGMLLNEEWASFLVENRVDWIALSIDGVNPETHDHFRVNADLGLIEENLFRLIDLKKRAKSIFPVLSFNMVGYPEIRDQSEDYVKRWLPHAGTVVVSRFRPVGSRKLWEGPSPAPFRACPLLYNQLVVSADGRAGLCCEDILLDVPCGNLNEISIERLYNESPRLKEYRKEHESGGPGQLALCRDCHVWGGDIPLETGRIHLAGMDIERTAAPAFERFCKV